MVKSFGGRQRCPSDCSVLIEGESGTGKELIARRLCAKSRRRTSPSSRNVRH